MSVFHRPSRAGGPPLASAVAGGDLPTGDGLGAGSGGEPPSREPAIAAATARPTVVVTVSSDLADEAGPLAKALGPAYELRVGPPSRSGVAVLSPRGTAAIAFYRMRHPDTAILVVERCADRAEQGAAEYLNGGADGYLSGQPTAVIAAQIEALVRRLPKVVAGADDDGSRAVAWGL
jgi:hypothetical protein